MKKIIAILLTLVFVFAFSACANTNDVEDTSEDTSVEDTVADTSVEDTTADTSAEDEVKVMTYAEYAAAELEAPVVIEAYVQAHQSWWDNKITVYAQDEDGAYFLYEMACSEEDAALLVPGTKIRVTGYKSEWEGEVEIIDSSFEIIEGESYIAEAFDATELLGTEELADHQNKLAAFKGLEVKAVEYKNGEPGDDIYLTLGKGDADYNFCVEVYLTGPESDVYTTVGALEVGDIVDVEGFLYWYVNVNPHITAIAVAE